VIFAGSWRDATAYRGMFWSGTRQLAYRSYMQRISPLSWLLIVVGLAFAALCVIYLTLTAPNLPSFVPGHVGHVLHARHYKKRAAVSLAVAVVAFAGAFWNEFRRRTPQAGADGASPPAA
jgi:amino acid permease